MKNSRLAFLPLIVVFLISSNIAFGQLRNSNVSTAGGLFKVTNLYGPDLFSASSSGNDNNSRNGHGKVFRKIAPNQSNGGRSVQYLRGLVDKSGIRPNWKKARLKSSKLLNGVFKDNIAQNTAVRKTFLALQSRPPSFNAGTLINNSNLKANLAKLADDRWGVFVFKGTVVTKEPIMIGANKTIWIDGTVKYTKGRITIRPGDKITLNSNKTFKGIEIPSSVNSSGAHTLPDVVAGAFTVIRGKDNVKFKGTKNSLIETNYNMAGICFLGGGHKNILIDGINFDKCKNVLSLNGLNKPSTIQRNFITNYARRGIHLKVCSGININRNLILDASTQKRWANYRNNVSFSSLSNADDKKFIWGMDGIDVDAHSKYNTVKHNLIIAGGIRYQIWVEISSSYNQILENTGIHLSYKGQGMQESGSGQNDSGPGQTGNKWKFNNVFYAGLKKDWRNGITMHQKSKFSNLNSIQFLHNYVWIANLSKVVYHNPKVSNGENFDVIYLVKNNDLRRRVHTKNLDEAPGLTPTMALKLFPNPATVNGKINVKFTNQSQGGLLQIYNLNGKLLKQLKVAASAKDVLLDSSEYKSGTYIIRYISDDGDEVLSKRMVIED